VPNERSSNARKELHQLLFAGQLERNARIDLDRSWGRVDEQAAEACSGSVAELAAQAISRPKAANKFNPHDRGSDGRHCWL
jgi:hypothetical protein